MDENDGLLCLRKIVLQPADVLRVCVPPSVDRLLVVSDDEETSVVLGQQPDDAVLLAIGVLEFVDEQVLVASSQILQNVRPVPQQVVSQEDEVVEIHEVVVPQLGLVGPEHLFQAGCQVLIFPFSETSTMPGQVGQHVPQA